MSRTDHGDFRPLPLLRSPHVQTLLGHLLPGRRMGRTTGEHIVRLADGDALVLHDSIPPAWRPGVPIAMILHGLAGSHASSVVQRIACHLLDRDVRVVRLDLRGAGKGIALARRAYNAGCSEDVRAALAEVHRWAPESPLCLAGISLGGAIALKLAGEAGGRPVPGLARVAALAPPIDLARCARLLALPRNRVYEVHFLRDLVAQARQRQRLFADLPPLRLAARLTLQLFDDLYTAPRGGFDGVLDYYRRASAFGVINHIQVPTLMITARDDPFVAIEPFEELKASPSVELHVVRHGGHLGFLGWDGAGGFRWAERRIADWLLR